MAGQNREARRTVGVTAPTASVRGIFRARPWPVPRPSATRTAQKSGAHGRIADGGTRNRTVKRINAGQRHNARTGK
jgi:hypothetical protein